MKMEVLDTSVNRNGSPLNYLNIAQLHYQLFDKEGCFLSEGIMYFTLFLFLSSFSLSAIYILCDVLSLIISFLLCLLPNSLSCFEQVKVCDICGDAGREDLLAICSRCSDGAEHTYAYTILLGICSILSTIYI